jgi:hypothetical protein
MSHTVIGERGLVRHAIIVTSKKILRFEIMLQVIRILLGLRIGSREIE